jgi:uncharacterized protein YgiM (DUF1202 family)
MQDLLNRLPLPALIGLILLIVVLLVLLVVVAQRRRNRQGGAAVPLEETTQENFGGSVDYTSMIMEDEPTDWRGRFARLSLPQRILLIALPVLLLLGGTALALALLPSGDTGTRVVNTPIPANLRITKADLVRVDPLQTIAVTLQTTGVNDNAQAVIELLADGQPIQWFRPDDTNATIRGNRASLELPKAEGVPTPGCTAQYAVRVSISGTNLVVEEPLEVLPQFQAAFCGTVAVEQPTTPPAPTDTPAAEQPTATPEPTVTPQAVLPSGPPAAVTNGGNVRRLPALADNVIGGINAGENVQVIERTPNALWYRVRTIRDEVGWVSASLLNIDATTAANVPVATVVSVFGNGGLYERPDLSSTQLERVNVDEVVELLQKTAAGDWYQVRNLRDIVGWVPTTLLGIPDDVGARVPVEGTQSAPISVAAPTATPGADTTTTPADGTGLSANVVNGGNVRRDPVVAQDNVVGGVNAGETVVLLARNADSTWYKVRTIRNEEGWVSASLLEVEAATAAQVPVE